MAASNIPARIAWAVDILDIRPSDQVLEIGCGRGVAASLVCERLGRGRFVAIDRAKTMIEAAKKRNRAHLESGKAQFLTVPLADADLGRRFSKTFAINVNLFWIDPSKELPVIPGLLRPNGALYLFYQPPRPGQLGKLKERLSRNLESGGLVIRRWVSGAGAPAGTLGVIATRNP